MDAWFLIIVIGTILVGGITAATWWWKLAARIAPYKDELGKAGPRRPEADSSEQVITIDTPATPGMRERAPRPPASR